MKKYIRILVLLSFAGLFIGFKMYHKPHEDMTTTKASFELSAAELYEAYQNNEAEANKKFLDKIIIVEGLIKETSEDGGSLSVVLESDDMMFGIRCELDILSKHDQTEFIIGGKIKFKGICTGSLMDVVLVRCVEV